MNLFKVITLSDGTSYTGQVNSKNIPHGFGNLTDENGVSYAGNFVDGVKEGNFTVNFPNGDIYTGTLQFFDSIEIA